MKKIIIADDHAIVRRGLRDLLQEAGQKLEIAEVADFPALLELVPRCNPDVVVMDVSMPGGNAFDALSAMLAQRPDLPVLVLTCYSESLYARRFFKEGAKGYVTKDSVTTELATAVQRLLQGKKYISPAFADLLAETLGDSPSTLPHEHLSNRELEVMRLIGQGVAVSEIARRLHLSVKTVSTYRSRILEKLRFETNSEIIQYAIQNQLL